MTGIRMVTICALAVAAAACGGACIAPPCAEQTAITVSVFKSNGVPLSGAYLRQLSQTDSIPCNQVSINICAVQGGPGTYLLVISAPGFKTVDKTIAVAAGAGCGCSVNTQRINVVMTAAP